METCPLKDSVLLLWPNGKFTVCSPDNLSFLEKQTPDQLPNFELAINGLPRLTLGDSLLFSGMEPTARGYLLHYRSPRYQLEVTTALDTVPGSNTVIQTNCVKNTGTQSVTLTSFSSAFLSEIAHYADANWYQNDALTIHICHSKWQGEGQWRQYTPAQLGLYPVTIHPFECEDFKVNSVGSRSTEHFYPLVMVEDRLHQKTWFLELEGSHNWFIKPASWGGYVQPRLSLEASGCNEENGGWYYDLKPGETYTCDRAFWGVSDGGFDAAVADLLAFKRADSTVHFQNDRLPVVFNDYMNCVWSQQDPALLYPLIDQAAAVGAEVFCIDGGWCEKVNGRTGIGDWLPNSSCYGAAGLRTIADHIRARGMIPGIWLELESCDPDAFGATLGADAVLKRHDAAIGDVYTYHFGNEQVCRYLTDRVRALYEAGFRYIKNDYNHSIGIGATNNYDGASAAEGSIVNADLFYRFIDSLYEQFPDLLIENCGGGAMRCDNKMLRRCYLQSTSDQELYFNNPSIVMGSSAVMPPEKAGIWAYPYPAIFPYDDQGRYIPFAPDEGYVQKMADGRETVFNLVTGMCGFLYLSGRIDACDEKNLALVKEGVQFYKQIRQDISHSRPVYPLGMLALGEKKPAALGLLSEGKLLLAVWNLTDAPANIVLDLAAYLGAAPVLEQTYPANTACDLAGSTLTVPLAPMSAAYLVLTRA